MSGSLARTPPAWPAAFAALPFHLLAFVPLPVVQLVLDRIARSVSASRPDLFARLGPNLNKRFMIDPQELPFVLVLVPNPERPHLKAFRRHERPQVDATIAGTFFNLLAMIEGASDGDALFFTRDLRIGGDIEAVVALRNALDDFDGNLFETILAALGPFARPAELAMAAMRPLRKSAGRV